MKTKIVQYLHRPNNTELGKGNTHETYMLIPTLMDLCDMFPPNVPTIVNCGGKEYELRSVDGREFRVNQMGPIYSDYDFYSGDEIIFTQVIRQNDSSIFVDINKKNRVVLNVSNNGTEVVNEERLKDYSIGERKYQIPVHDKQSVQQLIISFKEAKHKRSDSPTTTDFFDVLRDDKELDKATYYLAIGENNVIEENVIEKLDKCEYNIVEYDDDYLLEKVNSQKLKDIVVPIASREFDIQSIIGTIKSTNLIYEDDLIKRFVAALLAKPFVILSGLAGSGKTQLALAFAKALCAEDSQLCVVPVGADWTNREPLLGYPNALKDGEYVMPESGALQLMIDAVEHPERPYFLVLDEMNLSYVERYFADFLSAMESHQPIPLWCSKEEEGNISRSVVLPKNLFIIGTINVDETTYMFSPKVLDRANVIEFKVGEDEMNSFLDKTPLVDVESVKGRLANMGEAFVTLASEKDVTSETADNLLKEIFKPLKEVNAEFGYRSATEIRRFMAYAENNTGMDATAAVDAAIVQKLLPKLHGSRKKLSGTLRVLWEICCGEGKEMTRENLADAKYKLSADKVLRMYESANINGFTSFAEA